MHDIDQFYVSILYLFKSGFAYQLVYVANICTGPHFHGSLHMKRKTYFKGSRSLQKFPDYIVGQNCTAIIYTYKYSYKVSTKQLKKMFVRFKSVQRHLLVIYCNYMQNNILSLTEVWDGKLMLSYNVYFCLSQTHTLVPDTKPISDRIRSAQY